MKKWFETNKWKVLLSCIFTLAPILAGLMLWNRLPESMMMHWGLDGKGDGFASKAVIVYLLPVILCVFNLLCFWFSALDKKSLEQGKKISAMIFWLMPIISVAVNGTIYCITLDKSLDVMVLFPLLFGLLFIFIGNYMPKIKQNGTLGIKISWTLQNEENWNKTHRFAGKVWFFSGIIVLLTVFLPIKWMIAVFTVAIIASVVLPMVVSYSIYRKHQKEGILYSPAPKTKVDKIAGIILAILLPVIIVGICILMFTGNVRYAFGTEALEISTAYYEDLEVAYEKIETVEYRNDWKIGYRKMGFSSAKLSLGKFQNEEFNEFSCYIYNACPDAIILSNKENVLVINGKTTQETEALYNEILQRIENAG